MSILSIIAIEVIGLCLIGWVINLTRHKKLYVGFSVVWFLAVVGVMTISAIPPLLDLVRTVLSKVFHVSEITCVFYVFLVVVLINLSKQVSILANRTTKIAQFIALENNHSKSENN